MSTVVVRLTSIAIALAAAVGTVTGVAASGQAANPAGRASAIQSASQRPTFRSSVDLVSLTAIVRDRRGRIIRNLARDDFEVFDAGVRRPIVEFAPAEDGPVSVALLVDTSGSMRISDNVASARLVVEQLVAQLRPGIDEVALFAFDSSLRELRAFTANPTSLSSALDDLDAFGTTALWDAIGAVAGQLDERPHRRRALVVLTDGLDTSSRRSAADVSGIASASDVPVYVVTVAMEETEKNAGPVVRFDPAPAQPEAHLGNLAYWTGGALFPGHGPAAAVTAARAILAELRHQYLLAFESAGPGWRPVDVRLRGGRGDDFTVRTRSAYQSSRPTG